MNWTQPRPDFFVAENYFDGGTAREHLIAILRDGEDPTRGFHHPDVKPNRFHAKPKYPVKRYMCYGHYWNPVDYSYRQQQPNGIAPLPTPPWALGVAREALLACFPHHLATWRADSALVNYYTSDSNMGTHVDKDEADLRAPVIGISFGGTCRFVFENEQGEMKSLNLPGNSVYCFGERARLMRHGVGTTYTKTLGLEASGLLGDKERLSLTLRKVYLSSP